MAAAHEATSSYTRTSSPGQQGFVKTDPIQDPVILPQCDPMSFQFVYFC